MTTKRPFSIAQMTSTASMEKLKRTLIELPLVRTLLRNGMHMNGSFVRWLREFEMEHGCFPDREACLARMRERDVDFFLTDGCELFDQAEVAREILALGGCIEYTGNGYAGIRGNRPLAEDGDTFDFGKDLRSGSYSVFIPCEGGFYTYDLWLQDTSAAGTTHDYSVNYGSVRLQHSRSYANTCAGKSATRLEDLPRVSLVDREEMESKRLIISCSYCNLNHAHTIGRRIMRFRALAAQGYRPAEPDRMHDDFATFLGGVNVEPNGHHYDYYMKLVRASNDRKWDVLRDRLDEIPADLLEEFNDCVVTYRYEGDKRRPSVAHSNEGALTVRSTALEPVPVTFREVYDAYREFVEACE